MADVKSTIRQFSDAFSDEGQNILFHFVNALTGETYFTKALKLDYEMSVGCLVHIVREELGDIAFHLQFGKKVWRSGDVFGKFWQFECEEDALSAANTNAVCVQIIRVAKAADDDARSCNATFRYRHIKEDSKVLVVPPEYRRIDDIEQWMEEGFCIGRDGALISDGDKVYDLQHQKVFLLDYLIGSHILTFHDGVPSVAPTFLTLPSTQDGVEDEYVFAYNLLLLEGKCDEKASVRRVGRVAKALKAWFHCFRKKKKVKDASVNDLEHVDKKRKLACTAVTNEQFSAFHGFPLQGLHKNEQETIKVK